MVKVLELHLQHQPSNEYSGLISFRIDCFDLLAIQETLKSLFQHHSSKTQFNSLVPSILYGPTLTSIHDYWKNHSFDCTDLCQQSDVLAFNSLSRLVIAFLARSKHLSISWLQSPFANILEPPKKVCLCFHCFPISLP